MRFPFTVRRESATALITTEVRQGVFRSRHMSLDTLTLVGELCRQLQDAGREDMPDADDVPLFPGYVGLHEGDLIGVCHATVGFHRLDDGRVETVIALYDDGDRTAPVLMLVEEQIDEFIRQTK